METSVVSRNEASIPMGRVEPEEVAHDRLFIYPTSHHRHRALADGGYVAQ